MGLNAQRLKELFLAAAAIRSPEERAAFLDRECATDRELRQRLEALLQAPDDDSGEVLAHVFDEPKATVDPAPVAAPAGC